MPDKPDQSYLLTEQYKDATNLKARIRLHVLFSTNKTSWNRWAFEQFDMAPGSRILELGCGPGYFFKQNLDRIPPGSQITLSDFSSGMLQEAQNTLANSAHPFTFKVIDAQSIPFEDHSLDYVIANHMLYHVPDRPRAFAEIRRILKPGGRFYAATNGETHVQEIGQLMRRVYMSSFIGVLDKNDKHPFSLENGAGQLAPWFDSIEVRRFENELVVTEAEPLIAFILSRMPRSTVDAEQLQLLRTLIDQELAEHEAIHITQDMGVFLAQRRT